MSAYRTQDLSNEDAWSAMVTACRNLIDAALSERKRLLDLGFADEHQLCKEIDEVASHFAENEQVVRREWLSAICPEGCEVINTAFGFQIVQRVDTGVGEVTP